MDGRMRVVRTREGRPSRGVRGFAGGPWSPAEKAQKVLPPSARCAVTNNRRHARPCPRADSLTPPQANLIRRWSVGFSEESQKDCLYFSNDKCCPLCKKQAELALFMRKCEISNKDLLFLLGPVWVQAELGPALGRRAGEARTMGRCWPVPYARMVFAWGTWTGFWDVWRRGSFWMPLSVRGGPTLAEERTAECVPGVRGLVLPHPGVGQSPIALPVPEWDPLSRSLPPPLLRGKDLKDKEMF